MCSGMMIGAPFAVNDSQCITTGADGIAPGGDQQNCVPQVSPSKAGTEKAVVRAGKDLSRPPRLGAGSKRISYSRCTVFEPRRLMVFSISPETGPPAGNCPVIRIAGLYRWAVPCR